MSPVNKFPFMPRALSQLIESFRHIKTLSFLLIPISFNEEAKDLIFMYSCS